MAECVVTDCSKARRYKIGYCPMHYQRWKSHGDPSIVLPPAGPPAGLGRVGREQCEVEGCEKLIKARGWCVNHYAIWGRHGSPTPRLRGQVVDGRRICPGCGTDKLLEEYSPGTTGRCHRCVADARIEWRKMNPEPPVSTHEVACDCGKPFQANKRRNRYCSRECARLFKNKNNWPYMVARRARLREAFVESFDRVEIFKRDGWVCQLCHLSIDPKLQFPHPQSPSLDHVVPISQGGTHERSNAQASHLICNVKKADKVA